MVWYTFGPFSAYDPTQDGAAKASTFTVYDESDTANSTPLVTQNLDGLTTPVTSDSDGVVAAFRVEDHPAVKIVSGSYSIPAYSVKDMRDATLAAQGSAAASAVSAASTASSVAALDSWVKLGVTRYNQCVQPNPASATYWTDGTSSDPTFETVGHPEGRPWMKSTLTSATVTFVTSQQTFASGIPVQEGVPVVASADLMYSKAPATRTGLYASWYDAAGTLLSQSVPGRAPVAAPGAWFRVTETFTPPAGAVKMVLGASTGTTTGWTVGTDHTGIAKVKIGEDGTFFDGATPNTDLKGYAWSGTPNASVSQMIDYTVITNAATAQAQAAQDAAEDAQTAAEAAQSSAASLASGVVRKVNGVAPNALGEVTVSGGGSGSAVTSVAGKTGAVSLVKGDVGLGQVDNTSDANKPVSGPQATALAGKANASHTHAISDVSGLQSSLDSKRGVNDAIAAGLITSGTVAPARLGTGTSITTKFLRGDGTWQTVSSGGGGTGAVDSVNGQTGVVVLSAADVDALPDTYEAPVTSVAGLTGDVILNKNNVGLSNVDNTPDSAKPVSTLQQAALDGKAEDSAVVHKSGAETIAGVKTFSAAPVVPDGSFSQAKVSGLVSALAGKVGSSTVTDIVVLTAAAYNALPTPRSSSTLYIKVG